MSTTHWTVQGIFMVRNEYKTVNSARYIYGKKWALHSEQCNVHLWYEMSTRQWTVQGTFMLRNEYKQWTVQGIFIVRNEYKTVNSARYIYGKKWVQDSEQCKVHL